MEQLMWEGFMEQLNPRRKPTPQEFKLIEPLINQAPVSINDSWKDLLEVEPLNDGEMGSLRLFPYGELQEDRLFGEQASDLIFKDQDGVEVIATLYLDQCGDLFEIDIWKTDFSPTQSLDF